MLQISLGPNGLASETALHGEATSLRSQVSGLHA
jgi:hypothetical protein